MEENQSNLCILLRTFEAFLPEGLFLKQILLFIIFPIGDRVQRHRNARAYELHISVHCGETNMHTLQQLRIHLAHLPLKIFPLLRTLPALPSVTKATQERGEGGGKQKEERSRQQQCGPIFFAASIIKGPLLRAAHTLLNHAILRLLTFLSTGVRPFRLDAFIILCNFLAAL